MEAIFLKVLNMSAAASVVICAVLLVRLLLRRAPKKWSYLLWAVVAFRLACPVSIRAAFSLFALRPVQPAVTPTAADAATALEFIPPDVGLMAQPAVDFGANAVTEAVNASLPAATPMASANPMQIWVAAGTFLWCLGVAVMLLYAAVSYVRLRRTVADAVLLHGNVFETDRIRSPFILGFVSPRIYVPTGLDTQAMRYVLEHETYHLRRRDHLVKAFAFALLAVHWFNPLVWLAFCLMGKDLEMSCDEKVLGGAENIRKAYSTTLLDFATNRRFPAPSPLAFGETDVKSRIRNALRWKKPRLWTTLAAAALCVAVLAACTVNPAAKEKTPLAVKTDAETMTVAVPEQYAGLLELEAGENSVAVYEKASREAFRADYPDGMSGMTADEVGMGWLGTIARVDRSQAREELEAAEIGGAGFFARDDAGNYYVFRFPTDVRYHRAGGMMDDESLAQWTELNDWMWTVPADYCAAHPELTAIDSRQARAELNDETAQAEGYPASRVRAEADAMFSTYGARGQLLTVTVTDTETGRVDSYRYQDYERHSVDGTIGYWLEHNYTWALPQPGDGGASGRFVVRVASEDGHSLTAWSDSTLVQAGGEMFRCGDYVYETAFAPSHAYDLLLGIAREAEYADRSNAVTVPGSVTDYDEVARGIAEGYLRRLLDAPAWSQRQAQDGYVEASPVFDAYYGADAPNFCFGMGLRLKIDEPNTLYWQAGAGLDGPDVQGYYGWGLEVAVMKNADGDWYFFDGGSGGYSVYIPGYGRGFDYVEKDAATLIDLYFKTSGGTRDWRVLNALAGHPVSEVRSAMETLSAAQREALLAGMARYNEDYPEQDGSGWPPHFDLSAYR